MELVLAAVAVIATVVVVAVGMRRSATDMADFERHTPDPATGTSEAEWDFANR